MKKEMALEMRDMMVKAMTAVGTDVDDAQDAVDIVMKLMDEEPVHEVTTTDDWDVYRLDDGTYTTALEDDLIEPSDIATVQTVNHAQMLMDMYMVYDEWYIKKMALELSDMIDRIPVVNERWIKNDIFYRWCCEYFDETVYEWYYEEASKETISIAIGDAVAEIDDAEIVDLDGEDVYMVDDVYYTVRDGEWLHAGNLDWLKGDK